MKKKEFTKIGHLNAPILPNGLLHGWWRPRGRSYLYDTGNMIWRIIHDMKFQACVRERKNFAFATEHLVIHILGYDESVSVDIKIDIGMQMFRCPLCRKFHFVDFWIKGNRFFYAASCLDPEKQLKFMYCWRMPYRIKFDRLLKRLKIARKVVDYAKKIKH